MSKKNKLLTVLLGCLGLSACASVNHNFSSWTKKSDSVYLKQQSVPPLSLPRGLSADKVGDSFAIPAANSQGPVPVAITPPGGVYKSKVPGNPKETNPSRYFLKPLF